MKPATKFFTTTLLFALLGGALGAAGIKALDKPVEFFTIIIIAVLIDLIASVKVVE